MDGVTEDAVGGDLTHVHGGRTQEADTFDNPKADGKFVLARNHFHFVAPSSMNPPNFKVLIVERL